MDKPSDHLSSEMKPVGRAKEKVMSTRILIQMTLFLGLGVLLILSGAILAAMWSNIFNMVVKKEFTLSPDSKSYQLWRETPFPVYMEFYMFNWTNPKEVLFKKAKPNFQEMGPYVFREHHSKVNLTWNSNATVTFQNVRKWHFVPELSTGSLSDNVTNINVIAMTICSLIEKYAPKELLPIINRIISMEEPIYLTKSVDELLFTGYEDPFLNLAAKLKKFIKQIDLPFDKFGWFYGRNMSATYDGIFNMFTGSDDISKLGLLANWNYSDEVKYFKGKCGKIDGSTGEIWPVNSTEKHNATLFANDICSTLTLVKGSSYQTESGMNGVEFIGDGSVFTNESCYCVSGQCHPYGVRDISTCRFGAPAFVSFPHFYLADPIYNEGVTGLKPNSSLHQFQIALDEASGVPLMVNARLQVNIYSHHFTMISLFNQSLPEIMFPMLWFNQHAVIQGQVEDQLLLLHKLQASAMPLFLSILTLGVILGCLGIFLSSRGSWRKSSTHTLLIDESSQSSEVPSS